MLRKMTATATVTIATPDGQADAFAAFPDDASHRGRLLALLDGTLAVSGPA
jgi:hypothetical protein